MGPAPTLATYQKAATSIYAPEESADITNEEAATNAQVANDQAETGQVDTDYESAIDNLQNTIQSQTGQIGALYTSKLLGNISGLQGNDMGEMYAKADQQESLIEETRANKLTQISTDETNAENEEAADVSSLKSKYQGEEASYAESAYSTAVKDYNTEAYQQEELGLNEAKLNQTASYEDSELGLKEQSLNNSEESSYLGSFKAKAKAGGGFTYTGPNGEAIDLGQYAMTLGGGNTTNALNIIKNQLSQSSTSYDKKALAEIGNGEKIGASSTNILKAIQSEFNIDFGGTL